MAGIALVAVTTGISFAGGNAAEQSHETADTHFYSYSADVNIPAPAGVQNLIANNKSSDKNIDLGEFLHQSFRGDKTRSKTNEG